MKKNVRALSVFSVSVFMVLGAVVALGTFQDTSSDADRSIADVPSPAPSSDLTDLYDIVNPYYTIECSVSRVHKIGGTPGGIGGHALLYVKGACRDTSVQYPQLKMCDAGTDLTLRNSGVAVSVDKILANTQYIATDGYDFMFDGAITPGEAINNDALQATMAEILKSGALNGVQIHPADLKAKPLTMSDEEYIAEIGADTDYALSFARESTCVRIPMNKAQIQAEVDYINKSNEPYVSGKKVQDWTGLGNNCADFSHDVLASAGIVNYDPRSGNPLFGIFKFLTLHVEIPRNETLATIQAVNQIKDIKTADEVYSDKTLRDDFNKFGTLPEIGGIFDIVPMMTQNNSLYVGPEPTLLVSIPLLRDNQAKLKKYESLPEYTDLQTNLESVRTKLLAVQSQRKSIDADDQSDEAVFARKYNQWIDDSIIHLNTKIELLKSPANKR